MTRTRRTNSFAAGIIAAVFVLALCPGSARAAFSSAAQTCRGKISKDGSKLADKARKAMASCHKSRDAGKIGAGTDCNDVATVDAAKGLIAKAAAKLVADANSTCTGLVPADLLYTSCPNPCDDDVPAISGFQDVADCIVCVVEDHAEATSRNGQGNPSAPMANSKDLKCHGAIGKGMTKFAKTIVKERTKCQKSAEAGGATDVNSCISADPDGKIQTAETKGRASMDKLCAGADIGNLDGCSLFSLTNLKDCVFDEARVRARLTFKSFYTLEPGGGITTTTVTVTTTTSTTTTLIGNQDPQCPNLGELTLFAGTGVSCTDNSDCLAGTCDTGIGRCKTVTDLDTGWTGVAHDADINDQVVTLGNLLCEGPGPVCGVCTVTGINPGVDPALALTRTCRCSNTPNASFGNRNVCDQPFQPDANDCGGNICNCYFGPPLALSAGNTPACVVNRFGSDISGTANVDTGEGSITAHLRSIVFLGVTIVTPCPACGGTCTAGTVGATCAVDAHCDTKTFCSTNGDCTNPGGTCIASKCFLDGVCGNYDPTPNDGVRGGTCFQGLNDNQSCDVQSVNTTFPAPGGGGSSLDCFPSGANVSGAGLKIDITQTTGMQSLSAGVPCGQPPFVLRTCPCAQCSNDATIPCHSDAECNPPSGVGPNTCEVGGGLTYPNQCDGEACTDTGDGINGECTTGPDLKFCDAIVRANGEGFIACTSNGDCDPAVIDSVAGLCTLTKRATCFLDQIVAVGAPSPNAPIGAGIFCIGKTSNNGINSVAGLPGPGRVVNQGKSRTFCATDHSQTYNPGVGGCP